MISYTDFVWDGPNLRLYSIRGRIVATIVPDSEWAGMWQVKIGAEISDMVNLTRAKDAARSLCARRSEWRQEMSARSEFRPTYTVTFRAIPGIDGIPRPA